MQQLIEVERKRQLGDAEPVAEQLRELGYHADAAAVEVDTYYSRPDIDYMETVECLRVRESSGRAEITYKPPSTTSTHSGSGVISKPETNIAIADDQASAAQQLLDAIGMIELARVEKSRVTYRRPDSNHVVSIDTVTGAGVFIEVEVMSADIEAATVTLEQVEAELGLSACPTVELPYRDLVMQAAGR